MSSTPLNSPTLSLTRPHSSASSSSRRYIDERISRTRRWQQSSRSRTRTRSQPPSLLLPPGEQARPSPPPSLSSTQIEAAHGGARASAPTPLSLLLLLGEQRAPLRPLSPPPLKSRPPARELAAPSGSSCVQAGGTRSKEGLPEHGCLHGQPPSGAELSLGVSGVEEERHGEGGGIQAPALLPHKGSFAALLFFVEPRRGDAGGKEKRDQSGGPRGPKVDAAS